MKKDDKSATLVDRVVIEHVRVHIRWMIRRDMPEVLCANSLSWDESDFVWWLRRPNSIGLVAEYCEKVVGFVIYSLHRNRIEIQNFGVDQSYRRKRVGSQLIEKLVTKLNQQGRTSIDLIVPEDRLSMQLFLSRCGFVAFRPDRESVGYEFEFNINRVSR